eukprot:scaffold22174_cov101-Isochrysis_galbana.AAC.2
MPAAPSSKPPTKQYVSLARNLRKTDQTPWGSIEEVVNAPLIGPRAAPCLSYRGYAPTLAPLLRAAPLDCRPVLQRPAALPPSPVPTTAAPVAGNARLQLGVRDRHVVPARAQSSAGLPGRHDRASLPPLCHVVYDCLQLRQASVRITDRYL